MFSFTFSVSNPWAKSEYPVGWDSFYHKNITENKFLEIETYKSNCAMMFEFRLSHRSDHAGVHLGFGLFNRIMTIELADRRHWNRTENKWYD